MTGAHRLSTSPATPTATPSCSPPKRGPSTCSQQITVATTNVGTVTGKDKNGTTVTAQDTFSGGRGQPSRGEQEDRPIKVTLVEAEAEEGRQPGAGQEDQDRSPVVRSA